MTSSHAPLSGQSVLHYQIHDGLGAGGMGVVYRATDTRLGRDVALKFLPESLAFDPEARERLVQEARAAARLDHPNIGVIHGIEGLESRPFIVMALYQGQSLKDKLAGGPLGVHEALDICLQTAHGLAGAHESGIIHRDVKPANLFVTRQGLVKILDFGLARLAELEGLTRSGAVVGTLEYMAPEQVRGGVVDRRADLWALGVVLYEMLTGVSPFKAEGGMAASMLRILSDEPQRVGTLRMDVPAGLEAVLGRALAKSAEARYGSAEEMIADLHRAQAGEAVAAVATPRPVTEPAPVATTEVETPAPVYVLPAAVGPLVGRKDELAVIALNVSDPHCRILTLLGQGGAGKTRLALEAARAQQEAGQFTGGICFVSLDALTDPALIPGQIAEALGLELQGSQEPLEQVARRIGEARMLLVLDNYEQLMAGAELAAELVRLCPNLKLLVTSRERLNLEEEWVLPLQGLAVPAGTPATPDEARAYASVQLFAQRAKRADLAFALSEDDLPHVCAICRLVRGLPLGLELAAAWVRTVPCQEIAQEIRANLDFLTSAGRNVKERHRSLRATFEYSWTLLTPQEQEVFRRLSVFRGGFGREAAQEVAGAGLATLASLADKSLLQAADGRYDLHPLLHQYGREKLAETPDERARTEDAHGRYYHRFLQARRAELRSAAQVEAHRAIELELENVRAAWRWAVAGGRVEELAASCPPLDIFLDNTGRYRESAEVFAQGAAVLDEAEPEHQAALGELLTSQAFACFRLGRYHQASRLAERGLALLRPRGRSKAMLSALNTLGAVAVHTGDYEGAKRHWLELVEATRAQAAESQEGRRDMAVALGNLATLEYALGDYAQARAHQEEVLAVNRELGLVEGIVNSLSNLAHALLALERPDEARPLLEEGLQLARESNLHMSLPYLLGHLADVACELGDTDGARRHYLEALRLSRESGHQSLETGILNGLGRLSTALADYAEAQAYFERSLRLEWAMKSHPSVVNTLLALAQLFAAREQHAEAVRLLSFIRHHPATDPPVRDEAIKSLEKWQDRLSPEQSAAALESGKTATLEQVVAQFLPDLRQAEASQNAAV